MPAATRRARFVSPCLGLTLVMTVDVRQGEWDQPCLHVPTCEGAAAFVPAQLLFVGSRVRVQTQDEYLLRLTHAGERRLASPGEAAVSHLELPMTGDTYHRVWLRPGGELRDFSCARMRCLSEKPILG
jgi:hypothetical protein